MTKVSRPKHAETDKVPAFAGDNAPLASVEQAIWHAQLAQLRVHDPLAAIPPKPSALRVAILRAAHQLLDDPLVFEDPLALSILGAEGEVLLRGNPSLCESAPPHAFRASMVLRSRITEDQWAEEQQRGARQYVILGAGLDTYAYRHPNHRCRVFEVDLPAMIQWKRDCLRAAGIQEPDSVTFVPTDFERASLAEDLREAGLAPDSAAFFSLLGVTFYLDEETLMRTLGFVGSLAPGSGIVFDYAVHPDFLPPREQHIMQRLDKRMDAGGEPWKTHLAPTSFAETLHTLGFTHVEDLGPEEMNERYLSGRTDGMRKTALTRIIHARV